SSAFDVGPRPHLPPMIGSTTQCWRNSCCPFANSSAWAASSPGAGIEYAAAGSAATGRSPPGGVGASTAVGAAAGTRPGSTSRRSLIATPDEPAGSDQDVRQLAQFLDAAGDLVAGLEPDLLRLRLAEDHAFRGPGVDEVARLQGHEVGRIADQLGAAEHHVP